MEAASTADHFRAKKISVKRNRLMRRMAWAVARRRDKAFHKAQGIEDLWEDSDHI